MALYGHFVMNSFINLRLYYVYMISMIYCSVLGIIAQLVEHCTGIMKAMGLNPVEAWTSFATA